MSGFSLITSDHQAYYGVLTAVDDPFGGLCPGPRRNVNMSVVYDTYIKKRFLEATRVQLEIPYNTFPGRYYFSQYQDKYYGTFHSPVDPHGSSVTWRVNHRPRVRMKDFLSQRDAGVVVLNERQVGTINVSIPVGCYDDDVAGRSTFTVTHNNFGDQYAKTASTGCYYYDKVKTWDNEQWFRKVGGPGAATEQTWITPTSGIRRALAPGDAYDLAQALYAFTSKERDTCLVTSVVAEHRSSTIDLLTAAFEAPETFEMVGRHIRTILELFLNTRGAVHKLMADHKTTQNVLTTASKLWLEYRYGVMPLVYTIQDALNTLHAKKRTYLSTREGDRRGVDGFEYIGWSAEPFEVTHRCFMKSGFDVGFELPQNKPWIPTTAWELVPLSFVIDWALNIGDLIASLQPIAGVRSEGLLYSVKTDVNVTLRKNDWLGQPVTATMSTYHATPISTGDVGLTVRNAMTMKRWLDAFALSWPMFKRTFNKSLRGYRS